MNRWLQDPAEYGEVAFGFRQPGSDGVVTALGSGGQDGGTQRSADQARREDLGEAGLILAFLLLGLVLLVDIWVLDEAADEHHEQCRQHADDEQGTPSKLGGQQREHQRIENRRRPGAPA